MALKIRVKDIAQREEHINLHIEQSKETVSFHGYQGRSLPLPKIRIASDYLVYRMANFRTQTAQLRWLRENADRTADYFSTGEENASTQQVQHVLLLELSRKGTQSITPIYDVLKKEPIQIEPLLITRTGVIVNGNRRLAAMRQLVADEPSTHQGLAFVECIVLPGTVTARDLEEIEVQLQMARETKLPYSWIDQALAVRKLLADGVPIGRVRELMYLEEDDEVKSIISQLNEAELYLSEYKNEDGGYEQVDSDKQIFIELEKSLKGKEGVQQETRRLIAHVIIGNNQNVLDGRVYNYRLAFGKHHDEVLDALTEKFNLEELDAAADEDDLEIDIDDGSGRDVLAGFRALLKDTSRGPELAKVIAETLDDVIADKTEEKSAKRSLALAQKALNNLAKIDVSKTPSDVVSAVTAVLEQIEKETVRLIGEFEKAKT
ncbi:hypothetical protein [Herbaspirillum sp. C7C8]|uniref:hypothetical protein n=1 Tax=Herbaspirillum sp. C7C8 TaxID=2736665 RepID=UPI001F52B242|nr:hypothetical protein [Herbaspirillum sp. C7C8]MCI1006842.1 hypothetical protein [Herbaspirillum sp. C7C8]